VSLLCLIANLILVFLPSEIMNYFLPSYLYSVSDSAGVKLEKIGETYSLPLIKLLTSSPPFYMHFSQMEKQMASLESTKWKPPFKIFAEMGKWRQCQFSCCSSFTQWSRLQICWERAKYPGGISTSHLHCHCISPAMTKPRRLKCVGFALFCM
jgi:hypothetical protein